MAENLPQNCPERHKNNYLKSAALQQPWQHAWVYVPNPAAATAWFQSHTGKGWKYSTGFNNCSIYAMEGLSAGGAKIYHVGLNPAPSSVNSKPTIYWQFPERP